mgnify:CR=1 FL=1
MGAFMGTGTRTRIVKIGNSQGIRIPKLLLDQTKLGEDIEIEVQGGQLVVRPAQLPRQGWDAKFAEMASRGDDKLLDSEIVSLSSWDNDEWEW